MGKSTNALIAYKRVDGPVIPAFAGMTLSVGATLRGRPCIY